MATGTINGSVSLNSNGYNFYLTYTETPNVIANTSTVSVTAWVSANPPNWASDTVNSNFTQTLTINGQTFSQNVRVRVYWNEPPYQLITGTVTVPHNTGGTGTCAISAYCHLGTASYSPGYGTASGTITLTPIDRTAPTISTSLGTPDENSVFFTASSNVQCDSWAYSLNGGSYIAFSNVATTSVSYTIENLNPDTTYSIVVRAQKISNDVYGYSSSQSFTTEPDTPAPLTQFTATCNSSTTYLNGSTVTLSWGGTAGTVTGYQIQYATQPIDGTLSAWQTVANVTSSLLTGTYTDSNSSRLMLPAGTELIYRIAAVNGDNVSPFKQSNVLIRTGGMWINVNGTYQYGTVWVNNNGSWTRAAQTWFNNAAIWTGGG